MSDQEVKSRKVYVKKNVQIETLTTENIRLEAENKKLLHENARLQNAVDNMLKSQLDVRTMLSRLCSQFGVNFVG